ncbi:hypothetical protein [Ekhidna sp.]|uniref:hypothetical protein n=1 Tax=Ekhidna sp. TaxID=2608089 RepID=UPI0032972AF2
MKIKAISIIVLILLSGFSVAQEPEIGISNTGIRPLSAFSRNTRSVVEGNIHLDPEWKETILTFVERDKKQKYPSRFNLFLNVIEVKVFKNTYAVAWKDLQGAEVEGRTYIPLSDLADVFFGELLYAKDDIRLLKVFTLELLKANYNPALNTGRKYDEWNVEEKIILEVGGKPNVIKRKKDIQKALENTAYDRKKLNISSINESNLKELIDYLTNSK